MTLSSEEAYSFITTQIRFKALGKALRIQSYNGAQGTCSGSAVSSGRDSCVEAKTGMNPLHEYDNSACKQMAQMGGPGRNFTRKCTFKYVLKAEQKFSR